MKTSLKNYDVWYDGCVSIKSDDVETFISKVPTGKLFVNKMTPDIKQYNALMSKTERIGVKEECDDLDMDWNLPKQYQDLNVQTHILSKLEEAITDDMRSDDLKKRAQRVTFEMKRYKEEGLLDVLKCLIYVIDKFVENGVVWGVGRGSSVSSYVLYLIGVHDIDSVEFDLPFTDFMKT